MTSQDQRLRNPARALLGSDQPVLIEVIYLWGPDYVAESNVVDRHIHNLRATLQNHSRWPLYLATCMRRREL